MGPPRIAIAARGSARDGLGHFMRARALAEAFAALPVDLRVFLLGEESGAALFRHSQVSHHRCNSDAELAVELAEFGADAAVFDMLTLSSEAFAKIREHSGITVSLSPVFDRLRQSDFLVHRTVHEDPEWTKTAPFPERIKGLDYTIVSERCRRIPKRVFQSHLAQSPLSIAISMGGADAPNRTLEILNVLKNAHCSLLIWVALGEAYTHSYEALVKAVSGTKTLYKLSAADGSTLWQKALGTALDHSGPISAANGDVYLAAPDGRVRAYDKTGAAKWTAGPAGCYRSSAALGSDDVLYAINGCDGSLKAIDAQTGQQIWSLQVASAFASSPTLSNDGILWVGANKTLWAVTTGAASGLAAGWPKRHRTRANSSR